MLINIQVLWFSPFDKYSINKELIQYVKDLEKMSLVLKDGLIDFKAYNYISKEKTNISIERI